MKPTVYIEPLELEKIRYWVDKCPVEISGLGKVSKLKDGELYVSKVYLLEQESTSADTELDDSAVAKLLYETRNDEGELMFWWHSHHDMGVFWSGTDMAAIEQLGKNGMVVATVFNKKRESRTAIYAKGQGMIPDLFVDELELEELPDIPDGFYENLDKEYAVKFKEKKYKTNWHTRKGKSYYDLYDGDLGFYGTSIRGPVDNKASSAQDKALDIPKIKAAQETVNTQKKSLPIDKEAWYKSVTSWEMQYWIACYESMWRSKPTVEELKEFAEEWEFDLETAKRYA